MALADFDAFLAQMALPPRAFSDSTGFQNIVGSWPTVVTAPATAETCNKNTSGCLTDPAGGALVLPNFLNTPYLAEAEAIAMISGNISASASIGVVCDRLVQTAGLDMTVATPQTVNLPTPALPRYTSGEGVRVGVQAWLGANSSSKIMSVSYTNQDGVAGRTTPDFLFSLTSSPGLFFNLPLQDGDTGVRSVESFTTQAGTTVGNCGIVLYKPLFMIPVNLAGHFQGKSAYKNGLLGGCGSLIDFDANACLDLLNYGGTTSGTIYWRSALRVMDVP